VEDKAEFVCSEVAALERLLHETLASVHRNILRPFQVSLKREIKSCLHSHGLLHALISPMFCFHSSCLGHGKQPPPWRSLMPRQCSPQRLLLGRLLWHRIVPPSMLRMRRPGCSSGEGGTGEGIESARGECHGISICPGRSRRL
jgi:hypothetical protein